MVLSSSVSLLEADLLSEVFVLLSDDVDLDDELELFCFEEEELLLELFSLSLSEEFFEEELLVLLEEVSFLELESLLAVFELFCPVRFITFEISSEVIS